MARYFLLACTLFFSFSLAIGQVSTATLQGKVKDKESGELILFANVALYQNGELKTGVQTDFDGNYSISALDPGTYDLEVSYVGYAKSRIEGIKVYAGKSVNVDVEMVTEAETLVEVVVTGYREPLIEQDNTTQGQTVTSEEIDKLPSKSINGIVATTAGTTSSDDGGAINIRGSRSNATDYYIDGIRVRGSAIPQSEIDQMQVITGGIPSNFGDATGGIISITTKGPSRRFSGTAELETSQYLDPYGYNLGMLALSGPILKRKNADGERTGESLIGYRFSGQYRRNGDRSPTATGVYKVTDAKLAELKAAPLTTLPNSSFIVPAAQFLTDDDVELVSARPNSDQNRYDITGKIDLRLNSAMDISVGGSLNLSDSRPVTNSLMNWDNLRTQNSLQYRFFGRFRHRIGNTNVAADATDAEKRKATTAIRNASYTLQFSYNKTEFDQADKLHGNNLWNYGYIGNFNRAQVPVNVFDPNTGGFRHIGYNLAVLDYNPSEINPGLTVYNDLVGADYNTLDDFIYYNGFRPGVEMSVFGLHTNVNDIYNGINKNETNQYQFNASGSFEFLPGGSEKGKHTIEFGLMYEQRVDRAWGVSPRRLWEIGRQSLNSHFNGLDTNSVVGFDTVGGVPVPLYANLAQDAVWAGEDPENRLDGQSYFDKSVRNMLGAGRTDWINIDGLSPDQMSLDMFSADELNDAGLVGYYGYDYLGNPLSSETTFEDFFNARDASGELYRPIAPNTPIYTAAYVQDKFYFKDIIFRLGVRVDRYDANTKVLKDNYSLFGTYTADDFENNFGINKPSTVGGDYAVYVESLEGLNIGNPSVKAYRDGDQWYTAEGTPVNDSRFIFDGQAIPALLEPSVTSIQNTNYDPSVAFKDADPQVTVMPRLAFSFPISDVANFFAHYDILTQRPPSNTIATVLDYYYFRRNVTGGGVFNNPNLKPERTIDYEVGFQQRLSNSSALKLSAYYKELRDMIQAQTYINAFPLSYEGYGNQDFGTVKGFSAEFDLRRTGNVKLLATYTLQFADGTGSDANSQRGLASRGNLRSLFPLSFDERHRFTMNFDFRYGSGQRYNGPMINGKQIFANAGANLLATAASGRPYTRSEIPQTFGGSGIEGGINQARLPWNVRLDLRVDKDITLTQVTDEQRRMGKKPITMNVYLRVQNLLDTRNVLGVYSYSQSPDDDGFFSSQRGQTVLASQSYVDEYVRQYNWAMLNPGFYTLPRRIFLGAIAYF